MADRVSTRKTETRHPLRFAAALSRSDGFEARTNAAAPFCPHSTLTVAVSGSV
jgi:hypothetical protein